MSMKIHFAILLAGLLTTSQGASAFSVEATAKIDAKGDKPDAVLCRRAPNQNHTETQEMNKKNICQDHKTCTTVKKNARTALINLQTGQYDVCTKYVRTDDPCVLNCD